MITTWRMLRQETSPEHARQRRRVRHRVTRRRSPDAFHPSWGYHAEELLFYTSRYYAQTETFLREVGGVSDFCFSGFRAQHLAPAQREALARLLRRPIGHATARAVMSLMRRIALGRGRSAAPVRASSRHAAVPDRFVRSRRRSLPGLSPADPFLNLAERFGLPVRQRGRHLWVSFSALKRLLDAPSPALRNAVQEAIEALHDGGFHLHRRRAG